MISFVRTDDLPDLVAFAGGDDSEGFAGECEVGDPAAATFLPEIAPASETLTFEPRF
jgi:hypothetical protein